MSGPVCWRRAACAFNSLCFQHLILTPAVGTQSCVSCMQVGGNTWQFMHNMPTLKASDQAYMFAMSDNIFFSVLLAPGENHCPACRLQPVRSLCCTEFISGSPPCDRNVYFSASCVFSRTHALLGMISDLCQRRQHMDLGSIHGHAGPKSALNAGLSTIVAASSIG